MSENTKAAPIADAAQPDERAAFDVAMDALDEYQRNWDTGADFPHAESERIAMECAVEAVRDALIEARVAVTQAEPRLDKPAQVGNGIFRAGVKWSTVIGATQRHFEYMQTPEKEADRIARAQAFADFVQGIDSRAAATQARATQGVPEGWKLVPVEPTSEMLDAARPQYSSSGAGTDSINASRYKKMLAAAPQPVSASTVDAASGDGEAWIPTTENMAALPAPVRNFIYQLEVNVDPAGMVRDNSILRHDNAELVSRLYEAKKSSITASNEEIRKTFASLFRGGNTFDPVSFVHALIESSSGCDTASDAPSVVPPTLTHEQVAAVLASEIERSVFERYVLPALETLRKVVAALAVVQPSDAAHQWDDDGERCVRCGAKDWMPGGCTAPAVAQEAGLTDEQIIDLADEHLLDNDGDVVAFARALLAHNTGVQAQGVTQAVRDVLAERRRHVEAEGWTPEHDDKHASGELTAAAFGYLFSILNALGKPQPSATVLKMTPPYWPWDASWFKPGTPRRMLEKAGSLILAEIERIDRTKETQ